MRNVDFSKTHTIPLDLTDDYQRRRGLLTLTTEFFEAHYTFFYSIVFILFATFAWKVLYKPADNFLNPFDEEEEEEEEQEQEQEQQQNATDQLLQMLAN